MGFNSDELGGLLEGHTVVHAHRGGLVVDVDGAEVFVTPTVIPSGCKCCGDTRKLEVSYNLPSEKRMQKHGETDPLGLND